MSIIVFVQGDGHAVPKEVELPDNVTGGSLAKVLREVGLLDDEQLRVIVDEDETAVDLQGTDHLAHIKRGARIHVTRCLKIQVTVHFLERTEHKTFAAGARVRRVKKWAVDEFKLQGQDAAEHVLQICGSQTRPSTDTPLQQLTDGKTCAVCFDLVPEKRVEG